MPVLPTPSTVLCLLQCHSVSFFAFLVFSRELGYTGSCKVFFNSPSISSMAFLYIFSTWLQLFWMVILSYFIVGLYVAYVQATLIVFLVLGCSEVFVAFSVWSRCLWSCLCSWFVKFFSAIGFHRRQASSPCLVIVHDSLPYVTTGSTQVLNSLSFRSNITLCLLNTEWQSLLTTSPAIAILHLITSVLGF